MSKLEWNTKTLPTLGLMFLRTVRDKMHTGSTVRFGITGKGVKPHYQITHSNGNVIAFNAVSHQKFISADAFNDDNLSPSFDYQAITTAYEGTRNPK